MDYTAAGVDIEGGERFARFIASIQSKAVSSGIGGFSGGIEFDPSRWKKPLLMSTTDGVGTKLLVAQRLKKFDTLGIDLVAMNVNDLAVCGVQPLSFLDYIAIGRLDDKLLHEIIKGIVAGCELAGCVLTGGETAEMPDLYRDEDFDLAGFCVGIGEKDNMLPRPDEMAAGDKLYALPSSGVHSNGLSLARKALRDAGEAAWQELLVPTRIYVDELMRLSASGTIAAAAHITGGGLEGNLTRVLGPGLAPRVSWDWKTPPIFEEIAKDGAIETGEMRRVFNMGVGIALVVPREKEAAFQSAAANMAAFPIGELVRG
ncbi:MAG: phosphoribosylformylglycinamidine cyclo-ligase [Spirochaetaceae bacterium]|nr:phosphoribosylformylglycinamidine cyclo-ligase [Spirochaetaceae bacterium]